MLTNNYNKRCSSISCGTFTCKEHFLSRDTAYSASRLHTIYDICVYILTYPPIYIYIYIYIRVLH